MRQQPVSLPAYWESIAARNAVQLARLDEQAARREARAKVCRPPDTVDARAIRSATGLSRRGFANRFGLTVSTVRDWEQGKRKPNAAARVLLAVIATAPDAVDKALATMGTVTGQPRAWPSIGVR